MPSCCRCFQRETRFLRETLFTLPSHLRGPVRKETALKISVMTSGGDAPGMNACVRAVVKGARRHGASVIGIRNGGVGLIRGRDNPPDYVMLDESSVTGIVHESGTILGTAREPQVSEFLSQLGPIADMGLRPNELFRSRDTMRIVGRLAKKRLTANQIDGLILIGGDQTARGALAISEAYGGSFPMLVVPATIDNDVAGTEETIGFESAVTAAV